MAAVRTITAGAMAPAETGSTIERCNHPLSEGRTCCHVKGAPAIGYEPCPVKGSYGPGADDQCWHPFAKDRSHRHGHTWQMGEARYVATGGKVIDMETGEVTGNAEFGTDQIIGKIRPGRDSRNRADIIADAGRVLRLYGFNLPDDDSYAVPVSDHMKADIMVNWHYHGASGWSYGTDQDGHNYELSPEGKLGRIYSPNERREAVDYMRKFGPAKAVRKFGAPRRTIRSWAERG
jgi:hypothetical protein